MYGIGAREKYSAKPPRSMAILTMLGLPSSAGSRNPVIQRRDVDLRVGGKRRDRFVDRPRVDQRLVALDVDDDVAVERRRHFREPVGARSGGRRASAALRRRSG